INESAIPNGWMRNVRSAHEVFDRSSESNQSNRDRRPQPASSEQRHKRDGKMGSAVPERRREMIADRVAETPAPAAPLPPERSPNACCVLRQILPVTPPTPGAVAKRASICSQFLE